MKKTVRHLLLSLSLLGLVACTSQPVENPQQAAPAMSAHSSTLMHNAIVNALNERGWQVQQASTSQVLAEITVRGRHYAEVTIPYSDSQFQIQYRNSRGLDYKDGKIHRNYNKWVNLLREQILSNLQTPSTGQN